MYFMLIRHVWGLLRLVSFYYPRSNNAVNSVNRAYLSLTISGKCETGTAQLISVKYSSILQFPLTYSSRLLVIRLIRWSSVRFSLSWGTGAAAAAETGATCGCLCGVCCWESCGGGMEMGVGAGVPRCDEDAELSFERCCEPDRESILLSYL